MRSDLPFGELKGRLSEEVACSRSQSLRVPVSSCLHARQCRHVSALPHRWCPSQLLTQSSLLLGLPGSWPESLRNLCHP